MNNDNAKLIEALGGGDVGRDRLARLQHLADGRSYAAKCMSCKRWFVFEEFKRVVVGAPTVPIGPAKLGGCETCVGPDRGFRASTG